jgi:hypothetical protein
MFACGYAGCLLLASEFGASGAFAANANNGRRTQARCSPCHIVVPNQRQEGFGDGLTGHLKSLWCEAVSAGGLFFISGLPQ